MKTSINVTNEKIYKSWEDNGIFNLKNKNKRLFFSIIMPPPNITGSLHLGHALTMSLQDILIRYYRMKGYNVLYQPGLDHGGIATQLIIQQELKNRKISLNKLSKKDLIKEAVKWKNKTKNTILFQLKKMGISANWDNLKFTLDGESKKLVKEAFIKLYLDGKIYRDYRLINWDSELKTSISDLEVKKKKVDGKLYYIKYLIKDKHEQYITITTNKPETILGDSAVAVHPNDSRYNALIGLEIILPLTGRTVPIIGVNNVQINNRTGAIKINPASDFGDFEINKKCNLSVNIIFDENSNIEVSAIKKDLKHIKNISDPNFVLKLNGCNRYQARKLIVDELKNKNLLEKEIEYEYEESYGDRSDTIIEPRLTRQWFCDVSEMAKKVIYSLESGESSLENEEWKYNLLLWLSNVQPWCISRQLWWGHRIPVWYGPEGKEFVAKNKTSAKKQALKYYGYEAIIKQDEDVLDTWFSSALWPLLTLKWSDYKEEIKKYYPTSVIVTGFDILFFWIARMYMMSLNFVNEVPFKKIYIHGLIRDNNGHKMSKTKGNVVDPIHLIEKYGADALRFAICSKTKECRDIKIEENDIKISKKIFIKLTNAVSFLEQNNAIKQIKKIEYINLDLEAWIVERTNMLISNINCSMDNLEFNKYANLLLEFIQKDFCNTFLHFSKIHIKSLDKNTLTISNYVLSIILKLLHPVAPFYTEKLWEYLKYGKLGELAKEKWPKKIQINSKK